MYPGQQNDRPPTDSHEFLPVQRLANDFIAIGAQAYKTEVRGGTEAVFGDPGYHRTCRDLHKIMEYKKVPYEKIRRTPLHKIFISFINYSFIRQFLPTTAPRLPY